MPTSVPPETPSDTPSDAPARARAQRSVLIVFNPVSGKGRAAALATSTAQSLRARGVEALLLETDAKRDVWSEVRAADHDQILVVGGDGSIHAAANGLTDLSAPLAFAGTGTVNVLSVELGLPRTADAVAELLTGDRTLEVPLLECAGRRFLLFAEFGFLGGVVQRVNAWRTRTGKHGKLEFVLAACRVLPRAWGRPLRARLLLEDGTRLERKYSNLLATRARCYAGNMPMPIERSVEQPLALPSFLTVGLRTRTPFGHLLVLGLASAKLLPFLSGALQRMGLVDVHRVIELEVEAPAGTGMHLDAESPPRGFEQDGEPVRITATDASVRLGLP